MKKRKILPALLLVLLGLPPLLFASAGRKAAKEKAAEAEDPFRSETFAGLEFRGIGPALTSGRVCDLAIVPGDPNVKPSQPGDDLDNKTWTFHVKNEGCARFDYSTKWEIDIDPNSGTNNQGIDVNLSAGPVSLSFNWGGGSIPDTNFHLTPLPDDLQIEFATSDKGQGLFANGGSISIKGKIHAYRDQGTGKVYAANDHYCSGAGWLVDDWTWACRDSTGRSAIVPTNVYDDYKCVPEPTTVGLLLAAGCLMGLTRPRRPARDKH